jgi:NADH:ubiquinone oxidoreductase subunit 6 (subunit J)
MLLEIPSSELRAYHRGWSPLALFGLLGITKGLFSEWGSLWAGLFNSDNLSPVYTIAGYIPTAEVLTFVGHAFYTTYADILILNSLILTIALFGALVLANTR